jgi:hypothetical protein
MCDRNEICLSDYRINANTSTDFILHIAFYKEKNKFPNVEEYTLYIKHEIYTDLFKLNDINNIRKEFSIISNDKSDDAKFKVFRNKYKNSNNIIQVRFKRDHKKQKRIQAAIPYLKRHQFVKLFKPYKFKFIEIIENMKLSQEKRKELEKFYTKKDVVKLCMKNVKLELKKLNIIHPHILEPSAGSGVFIDAFNDTFDKFTYDAYDIQPEAQNIIKADFLKKDIGEIISIKTNELVVIGNLPYKLAIKFINRCAELNASLLCFVLPNVFKKPTIINKINTKYHLIKQVTLPKNSFELGDDDYDVPSSFFIFSPLFKEIELVRDAKNSVGSMTHLATNNSSINKEHILRPLINLDILCIGYKYISFKSLKINNGVIDGADISIIRVGGRAGKAFLTNDVSDDALVSKQKYNYFIKLDKNENETKKKQIINKINEIKWDKNNTTGPRSIGKYELNSILNNEINNLK